MRKAVNVESNKKPILFWKAPVVEVLTWWSAHKVNKHNDCETQEFVNTYSNPKSTKYLYGTLGQVIHYNKTDSRGYTLSENVVHKTFYKSHLQGST